MSIDVPTGKPAISRPREKQVEHRELLGDPDRRVVERDRVAEHGDRRLRRAAGQDRGDQVRRRHQAVAVVVVLVDADRRRSRTPRRTRAGRCSARSVSAMHLAVEQAGIDVDPHAAVLRVEVLRQLRVRHQVEPHASSSRRAWSLARRRSPRPSGDTDHVAIDNDADDGRWPVPFGHGERRPAPPAVLRGRRRGAPLRAGGGAAAHVDAAAVAAHPRARGASSALALFERTSRRVTLTPAGERLLGDARAVLAAVDRFDAVRRASSTLGAGRPRRSATATAARAGRCGPCGGSATSIPTSLVRPAAMTSLNILEALRVGRHRRSASCAGRSTSRTGSPRVPLARVPVDHVAVPLGHRLAGAAVVDASDLDGEPVLVVDRADAPTAHDEIAGLLRPARRPAALDHPRRRRRSSGSSTWSRSAPASAGSTPGRPSASAGRDRRRGPAAAAGRHVRRVPRRLARRRHQPGDGGVRAGRARDLRRLRLPPQPIRSVCFRLPVASSEADRTGGFRGGRRRGRPRRRPGRGILR